MQPTLDYSSFFFFLPKLPFSHKSIYYILDTLIIRKASNLRMKTYLILLNDFFHKIIKGNFEGGKKKFIQASAI